MRGKRTILAGSVALAFLGGGCQQWVRDLDREVTGDPTIDPATREVAPVDGDINHLYAYDPPRRQEQPSVAVTPVSAPTPAPASEPLPAPSRPTSSPAPSAASRTYRIQRGDTLSGISRRFYGQPNGWRRIYDANRSTIQDPGHIRVGQEIVIP